MMKKLARQLPAYAVGVYLATGLMDGIWNPLHWGGQQWAAAVLAGVMVWVGSWAWSRWKAKRG
ncbi:MAG: hypothetical protein V8Q84_11215 [Bilophila sp.]